MKMFRDIVVTLAAVAVIVFVASHFVDKVESERERAARLVGVNEQIDKLEAAYRKLVFDDSDLKGIYQQIFRQNEILLEYQKLLLTTDLVRADETLLTPALLRK